MLNWILTYSHGARKAILGSILLGTGKVAASLTFVYFCKHLIDIATQNKTGNFTQGILFICGAMLCDILMNACRNYYEKRNTVSLQNRLQERLFLHLLACRWQSKQHHHSGDTMNRLSRDVKECTEFLTIQLPSFLIALLQFLAAFLFLLVLDARLAWLMIGIVPFFLLLSKSWYRRMKQLNYRVRMCDSDIQALTQEGIQNELVIKTHGALHLLKNRLNRLQTKLWDASIPQIHYGTASRALLSLGFVSGYILTFTYGAYQLKEGVISYGILVAFLQLVGRIQQPVAAMSGFIPQLTAASTAAERLDELFELPTEETGVPIRLSGICGISVQGLSFSYEAESRIIYHHFSYNFSPGSRTLILGETGAGKTTLFRLILSLIQADAGSITLYNEHQECPVSNLTRENFLYVPQGNTLLSGTIRENLLLAKSDASQEEIANALHAAAADFVYRLPKGIDTRCGEEGGLFSEGEAQRIAIARALLGKGSILLFDEFSSALDEQTTQTLLQRLSVCQNGKTMLFITHNPHIAQNDPGYDICRINRNDLQARAKELEP